MAVKTHGYTSQLQYDLDGLPPFAVLADCKMITPPNLDKGVVDTTHLESPQHTEECIAGWRRSGEIPFELYFHKTMFAVVLSFYQSETLFFWRSVLPLLVGEVNNSYLAFVGFMKSVGINEIVALQDDAIMVPCAIKISGPITFVAGS